MYECVLEKEKERRRERDVNETREKERRKFVAIDERTYYYYVIATIYIFTYICIVHIPMCIYIHNRENSCLLKEQPTTNRRKEKNRWLTLYTEIYTYKL